MVVEAEMAKKATAPSAYVMRGVWYALKTPAIWKKIVCPLFLGGMVGLVITIVLFAAAMAPQAHALINANVPSGWAWFLAFFFTLLESILLSAIVVLIIFGTLRQQIFDLTYEKNAAEAAQVNLEAANANRSCLKRCSQECKSCGRLGMIKLCLVLITLPLNLIPIVGTVLWAYLNGVFFAWDLCSDYFVAHGVVSFDDQYRITRADPFFHSFGFVALMCEALPIVGLFFIFSNAAGAALYAAKYEPALAKGGAAGQTQQLEDRSEPRLAHI